MADYRSPLLDLPGAVPADPPDEGVANHYGDPLREQRTAATAAVSVDRSHRGVLRIAGADRLSWLHSLTSQHLEKLPPWRGTRTLVLSPHGHVEHDVLVLDDGEAVWLDVEPGTQGALLAFLDGMRFLLRVEPADVTAERAVLSVVGPDAAAVLGRAFGLAPPPPVEVPPPPGTAGGTFPAAAGPDGLLVRWMPYGADLLVPRAAFADVAARIAAAGAPPAGIAAFEALRVAARQPRLGQETDHRTIPHEVGWLPGAVHLEKGCYRGQETVARVHNLGRPPRRMVLLHLDGLVVGHGAEVVGDGRTVGTVGTAVVHHELGPIALAVIKRSVPDDARLTVGPADERVDASIDPGPDDDASDARAVSGARHRQDQRGRMARSVVD